MIKMGRLNRAENDSGFTLIELMVVVTIVGVLAAVAIPRYISYVRTSQTAEVGQIAGSIVAAMRSYADAQSLTPAATATLFNTQVVTPAGVAAPAGKDLKNVLPQINVPANTTFTYTVAAVATGDEAAYCITAKGNDNAGVKDGLVLYSSTPALTSTGGWAGRIFNRSYINGLTDLTAAPAATAGGYCTAAGGVQATPS